MKGSSKKIGSAIIQALISGGVGYGVALLGDKGARMVVKDPASQDLAGVGGRLASTILLAYMGAKGKAKKLPVNMQTATIGSAIATGAKALELPQLAPVKALTDKVFAGDEMVFTVRTPQDAMRVARAMQGSIAFAGEREIAFAGGNDATIYDL